MRVWSLDATRALNNSGHSLVLLWPPALSVSGLFSLGCILTCSRSSPTFYLETMFLSPSARLCRTRWLSIHLGRRSRGPLPCQNYAALLHSSPVNNGETDPTGEVSPQPTQQAHSGALSSNCSHCHPHDFPTAPFPRRTHTCGALLPSDADKTVVLTGWLMQKGYVYRFHSFLCMRC